MPTMYTNNYFYYRLRYKRDFRLFVRCLSDKPTDDGKVPEIEAKQPTAAKKSSENATEKIQELLKSMLAAPKISEKEYAQKFATAPDPRRKNKDMLGAKTEKIGKLSIISKSVLPRHPTKLQA